MKPIHIGIDGNEANVQNRVGSNKLAHQLLIHLHKLKQNVHFTVYLKDKPLRDMPWETSTWKYRIFGPSKAWTQWRLPLELFIRRPRPDIFFSPGHYAPRVSPVKTAVTILDLSFLKFPNLFLKHKRGVTQLKQWTAYSVNNSTNIFAISQHTKNDILDIYHVPSEKVQVVYPGIDHIFYQSPPPDLIKACQVKYQLPSRYILHVGTLQPRKNIARLVEAFDALPEKYGQIDLVLAGQSGWLEADINQAINKAKKVNQIRKIGFVAESDMPALYAGAECLAMIGLYEGFGFPAAEAIAAGCIPVVANTASLPEVVGQAGICVDPYSVHAITKGFTKVLTATKKENQQRLTTMQKHIKKFRWDMAAQSIVDSLQIQVNA